MGCCVTLTRLCGNIAGAGLVVGGKRHVVPDDWEQQGEVIAAGTSCPMPDCGALTLACRSKGNGEHDNAEPWEFTCPHCGVEFTAAEFDF